VNAYHNRSVPGAKLGQDLRFDDRPAFATQSAERQRNARPMPKL